MCSCDPTRRVLKKSFVYSMVCVIFFILYWFLLCPVLWKTLEDVTVKSWSLKFLGIALLIYLLIVTLFICLWGCCICRRDEPDYKYQDIPGYQMALEKQNLNANHFIIKEEKRVNGTQKLSANDLLSAQEINTVYKEHEDIPLQEISIKESEKPPKLPPKQQKRDVIDSKYQTSSQQFLKDESSQTSGVNKNNYVLPKDFENGIKQKLQTRGCQVSEVKQCDKSTMTDQRLVLKRPSSMLLEKKPSGHFQRKSMYVDEKELKIKQKPVLQPLYIHKVEKIDLSDALRTPLYSDSSDQPVIVDVKTKWRESMSSPIPEIDINKDSLIKATDSFIKIERQHSAKQKRILSLECLKSKEKFNEYLHLVDVTSPYSPDKHTEHFEQKSPLTPREIFFKDLIENANKATSPTSSGSRSSMIYPTFGDERKRMPDSSSKRHTLASFDRNRDCARMSTPSDDKKKSDCEKSDSSYFIANVETKKSLTSEVFLQIGGDNDPKGTKSEWVLDTKKRQIKPKSDSDSDDVFPM